MNDHLESLILSKRQKTSNIKSFSIPSLHVSSHSVKRSRNVSPKLPPIVIPFSPIISSGNSQPRTFQSNNLFHTTEEVVFKVPRYPLTPHPQPIINIIPYIQHISADFDYSLINEFETEKPTPEMQQKNNSLNSLIEASKDPVFRHGISKFNLAELFSLLRKHIIRPIPKIIPDNPFSEVSTVYSYRNWSHINKCHTILLQLISDSMAHEFLTPDFLLDLISQLDSPVIEAQKQIESELTCILTTYENEKAFLLDHFCSKLILALDNGSSNCLNSILSILLNYYRSVTPTSNSYLLEENPHSRCNSILDSSDHHFILKHIFIPLLSLYDCYKFKRPLFGIIELFCKEDPEISIYFLKWIYSHWPIAYSQKHPLFFQAFQIILPLIPQDKLANLSGVIVKIITKCVQGAPQASISALFFISDPGFIGMCNIAPQNDIAMLRVALEIEKNHWKAERREMVTEILNQIPKCEKSKSDSLEKWKNFSKVLHIEINETEFP